MIDIFEHLLRVLWNTFVRTKPRPEEIIWSLSTSWKSETLRSAGNINIMTSNLKTARGTVANSHDAAHPGYCDPW